MTRRAAPGRRVVPILLGFLLAFGVNAAQSVEAEAGGLRAKRHSTQSQYKSGRHKGERVHRSKRHHSGGHSRRYSGHYRGYYGGYYGRRYYNSYYYPWGYGYPPQRYARSEETRVERGFRYLVEGDPKRAVGAFSKLAEAEPYDARPKLGYAIAMSELGNLDLGVWAMRRAIRTDPEALRNAPLSPVLRPRVRVLLDVYHPAHSDDSELGHDEDAHFMVAALLWVLGDQAGASAATQWALADGDNHESTLKLWTALSDRAGSSSRPESESEQESSGS